ncbi:MAG TPA: hypothetical protein VNA88_01340, partial [Candidatus Kapabacteria bacterium]|nr:hypothetical protein [Candidatus Kapabacteria bacterium]
TEHGIATHQGMAMPRNSRRVLDQEGRDVEIRSLSLGGDDVGLRLDAARAHDDRPIQRHD